MSTLAPPKVLTVFGIVVVSILGQGRFCVGEDEGNSISFNRDIRPILSDKCFQCHGPDEESREADLRFDIKAEAFNVIEPGSSDDSDLIHRILEEDPDERMPPADLNKPLTAKEIELLKTWVDQGAEWSEFWAYEPPQKRDPPTLKSKNKYDNWIDQFVAARLEDNSLALAPPADKVTLLRRLYFDLIGLPPTPAQVEAFLDDSSPDAVEQVVDELLASQHFGERLAIYWLDLVRFADTVGYHGDQPHNISPYRDWVINAFNDNMPFDQFTREQLAGDLLPNSTQSQKIASGYNRLLQTTHEGGLQPKEYSAIYAADRVRNVSLVWMGATVGCAQCHDHKYDPYTSRDFYALSAFFADLDDEKHFKSGTNTTPTKRPPELLVITPEDREKLEAAALAVKMQTTNLDRLKKELAKLGKLAKNGKPKAEGDDNEDQQEEPNPSTERLDNLKTEVSVAEQVLNKLKKTQQEIESRGTWTMISAPLPQPRVTRILARGNWMDESGTVVQPAIPEFMGKIKSETERATRLDLANWLTDRSSQNGKLTARVFANRFWYLLMGVGVSRSLDDFGGQGHAPAYPELLDNLALEFVENDWNIKHLIRLIVTSKTYQQASVAPETLQTMDPYNQLFAHQSRYRLPAELIRDNALAVSGLLNVDRIGGKSVKPVQPAGYYQHLNFPTRKYVKDNDDQQWRRGVYVHWQRMFLHPSLKAFDAPSREECTARRPQSNTPSAALALLNDPIFVEAARVFAERIIRETDSGEFESRLPTAFLLALSRKPDPDETRILKNLYEQNLSDFQADSSAAEKLLAIGEAPRNEKLDPLQHAAWTTVARAILNMNEAISRN